MNNALEAILQLERKLKTLLSNYEFLKKENDILLQNINNLEHQILEKTQLIEVLNEKYNTLKIAKTINGGNTNTKDTKLKINTLIREIDKCITELNQ